MFTLASSGPRGSLDSINSHIGLSRDGLEMSRSPSPHMVLALEAGVVSQELLDALTAVDNKLSSACLFAEYWDTHSERDAWFQQHLSSQLHSLAVPLHQWCCDHSASWARGAVHIPVKSSPPSCQPTASSSATTASVTGNKRRYAAITSNGRHRPQPSSSLPPDGPLLYKAAREQEEYQQVLEVTLNLVASFCQIPGLLQELSSSTLCSDKQTARLRKIISATAPSAGTLRAHNLSFKRFLLWGCDRKLSPSECFLKSTNIDIADFMEKLAYKFLDVPTSFSLTASVIMAESQFYLATLRRTQVLARLFPPEVFKRLSSSAFAGLLRFHRSDLGDRKLHVAKSENSKIAKCGFMLPSSSAVTISDLDRLIGEGVTLCGHACFNTTCSLATVLKGGADC